MKAKKMQPYSVKQIKTSVTKLNGRHVKHAEEKF